jgi:hypothetical protein
LFDHIYRYYLMYLLYLSVVSEYEKASHVCAFQWKEAFDEKASSPVSQNIVNLITTFRLTIRP